MRRNVNMLAVAGIISIASAAFAHEVWLEAPRFRLQPGETVHVRAFVGTNFSGGPWTTKAAKVQRLRRFGPTPADTANLTPKNFTETDTFRTAFTFAQPGTHVVLLQSTSSFIELPADQFTAYLREEGLDYALKLRQENEETTKPGRETYSRCAKTLLQVGDPALVPLAADSACRHAYGLPLELVPEQNPYRLAADKALTVRVLRGGKPAFGAAVQVWQRQPGGLPTTHYTTRANQSGRILLRLSGPGPYLLATVDMRPAPARLHTRADWQSTWASLTFAGPPAAIRPAIKH
ncbi:DUF4198 domain-containing protein [Hymenobacter sp. DH14]|uniref:DUF4198 domain-containing protein n=1 Tax=Hymenobacter cyanobacteriorum TaxID=2926463 RepID=A0A9X1VCY0_9BACT|nr:DUF4198 domain-containing protein [Hymenobacter cyanobacteriorum]MCI1186859.1 DUF4198 domain-containing protein [Hymenobacter cyanobacteriorum]